MQGGVGDVGKFAVAHALRAANVIVKPIAMTSRATTPAKFEFQVDVEPRKHREAMQAIFEEVTPAGVCNAALHRYNEMRIDSLFVSLGA